MTILINAPLVVMTDFDTASLLVRMNSKKPAESEHVFKVPTTRVSLLGFDKLAAQKRKRNMTTRLG